MSGCTSELHAKFIRTPRLATIQESTTLKLNALVQDLKAQGKQVYNLTAGEPDFPPPEPVVEAMLEAVRAGKSKYTPVAGIPELRKAVARYTNSQQVDIPDSWEASNVVVSNGGKQACFNTILSLLSRGDSALVVAPYWLSYTDMIRIAEATPVIANSGWKNHFKLQPQDLRKKLKEDRSIKLVILNSPSNPSGVMYSQQELRDIGDVLLLPENKHVWVMSDEIYDSITFEKPFVSFLAAVPEMQSRTVTVNGLSKSGAITGWRLGWSVAPSEITQSIVALQGQCTSGANAPTQWAALAALDPDNKKMKEILAERRSSYQKRRDLCLEILSKNTKIKGIPPEGAFYYFFQVEGFPDGGVLAEKLLKDAGIAVVPGEPFGLREFVRISFATDDETLRSACKKLVSSL